MMLISKEKRIGNWFGQRSKMAICFVLAFLLALPVLAGGNVAQAASDTSSWMLVDDGGLAKNTTQASYKADLIEYKGNLYVLWSEEASGTSQMHAMKYDGTGWLSVDEPQSGCIPSGCLNAHGAENKLGNRADSPSLAVYKEKLYAAWHEGYLGINLQARVRQFDGDNWTTVDGGTLNVADELTYDPRITIFNDELYAIWQENSKIQVKKHDGTGTEWQIVSPSSSLSVNGAAQPQLAAYDGSLYAVWREETGTPGVQEIKVSRYAGGTDWVPIDEGGFGVDGGTNIQRPNVAVFENKMYVAWSDNNRAIRVKSYDEQSGWQWADNNAGLNYTASNSIDLPKLIAYDGYLYAVWVESGTIRAKKYDGNNWTTADSDHGLNARIGSVANNPSLAVYNGKLFAVWTEKYDGKNQVRVARMPVFQAPDAPQNVKADAGDGGAMIKFDPPASNGGSPITEYTVTSSPEGITKTGSASPIKVTGLTNGQSYTFTVTAKNASGTSVASTPTSGVTPKAGFKNFVSGEFNFAVGVAVDRDGNVYVENAEDGAGYSSKSEILKFDKHGAFVTELGQFDTGFPLFSTGKPSGIAVTVTGTVYAVDNKNHRVSYYDSNGSLLGVLGDRSQFNTPLAIAVDETRGRLYVAEQTSRIKVLDDSGNVLQTWGSSPGNGSEQFYNPSSLGVDGEGNVYVLNTGNSKIKKLNSDGELIGEWGGPGTSEGQFIDPAGIAVDVAGNVYVADTYKSRIQKFDSEGRHLETWAAWGTWGSDEGQFRLPYGIAVDINGNVYVADTGNNRIQVLRSESIAPSITTHPSDTTVTANGSASFSVTATGTGLTYQWQVNRGAGFENINGATNSTLTLSNVTTSMSGYQYRVVIASGTQSTTSNAALLTVNSESGSGSGPSGSGPTPPAVNNGESDAEILVNGKAESAGKATTTTVNNRKVTTITVDAAKLDKRLAAEGDRAVVTIPVSGDSDVVIGELNGQMIKNMENRQAVLEIRTNRGTYTVPALQIDIDAISKQIGAAVALSDIIIRIEISASAANIAQLVKDAAAKGEFTIVAPPVDFKITSLHGDKTVEITKFNAFVQRTIAIPAGVDPSRITTGIVVDSDGKVRHVPTKIIVVDGKHYAQINSLTNSTYSVVWHPISYSDMTKHWAQAEVNDMGSRMVIEGTGSGKFSPDRDITRAEFAAIVVRGLGLKLAKGATPFADVAASDWYAGAVNAAYKYGLIDGVESGKFHPNDQITREQAMLIIAKAMAITGLKEKLPAKSEDALLKGYSDISALSGWARSGAADTVQAGILTGRNETTLAPKAYMTRAEVAVVISRLLKQSGLI
ncbi:S-layer homology domain-containing protein [Cohnella herbarum]|uniref:Uncharacterized protein n=1 Tax=Cohnella herbarum TaxID=2728023 RepID=A0A7Z2VK63_9BACL|nr:S-layer homology domain-containing protein [Cohnella herbarum]QJD84673.1 hypothetical protein HH215_16775 [Cohnella herbarum]